jgi:hypothetical protein
MRKTRKDKGRKRKSRAIGITINRDGKKTYIGNKAGRNQFIRKEVVHSVQSLAGLGALGLLTVYGANKKVRRSVNHDLAMLNNKVVRNSSYKGLIKTLKNPKATARASTGYLASQYSKRKNKKTVDSLNRILDNS